MVRSVTQILMGLMLLFGAVMLAPRGVYHLRRNKILLGLYFFLLSAGLFAFAVFAFQYAYSGLTE